MILIMRIVVSVFNINFRIQKLIFSRKAALKNISVSGAKKVTQFCVDHYIFLKIICIKDFNG